MDTSPWNPEIEMVFHEDPGQKNQLLDERVEPWLICTLSPTNI